MTIMQSLAALIRGRNASPTGTRGSELEILSPPTQGFRRKPPSVATTPSGTRLGSSSASAGFGRLRFQNQGGGYGAEHTSSNLG